ncbi:MAG: conjugal transfer protein TrbD [Betaproteobacteria bacterium]|nr:conjugal transfer protein TrbD [Betaproteobacteria bacterium]
MELRKVPIRRIGNRSNLFMGGDRELVMLAGLIAFSLVFNAQEWRAAIIGTSLWVSALFLLRLMAKSDPQMRPVYLRHRRYKAYYAPRATPFRSNGRIQERQYR